MAGRVGAVQRTIESESAYAATHPNLVNEGGQECQSAVAR